MAARYKTSKGEVYDEAIMAPGPGSLAELPGLPKELQRASQG